MRRQIQSRSSAVSTTSPTSTYTRSYRTVSSEPVARVTATCAPASLNRRRGTGGAADEKVSPATAFRPTRSSSTGSRPATRRCSLAYWTPGHAGCAGRPAATCPPTTPPRTSCRRPGSPSCATSTGHDHPARRRGPQVRGITAAEAAPVEHWHEIDRIRADLLALAPPVSPGPRPTLPASRSRPPDRLRPPRRHVRVVGT